MREQNRRREGKDAWELSGESNDMYSVDPRRKRRLPRSPLLPQRRHVGRRCVATRAELSVLEKLGWQGVFARTYQKASAILKTVELMVLSMTKFKATTKGVCHICFH